MEQFIFFQNDSRRKYLFLTALSLPAPAPVAAPAPTQGIGPSPTSGDTITTPGFGGAPEPA